MSKKGLIISVLLAAYTIVLVHAVVPHYHVNSLFETEHHDNNECENYPNHSSTPHHHFPFSHNVSLHATIDKPFTYSYQVVKAGKKIHLNTTYSLNKPISVFSLFYCKAIIFEHFVFLPHNVIYTSLFNRPPPVLFS